MPLPDDLSRMHEAPTLESGRNCFNEGTDEQAALGREHVVLEWFVCLTLATSVF